MTATGNNYAEALFMLAREENLVDEIYEGLKTVKSVFDETPEYMDFLSTPSISKSERTDAVEQAFGGRINEHTLSFLQLLCEHAKAESFNECFAEYERLREFANSTVVAVVKTAVELSADQIKNLTTNLCKRTGKNVTVKTVIDKTLLGGIMVELDDKVLDGSIKNNLKRVRDVISV